MNHDSKDQIRHSFQTKYPKILNQPHDPDIHPPNTYPLRTPPDTLMRHQFGQKSLHRIPLHPLILGNLQIPNHPGPNIINHTMNLQPTLMHPLNNIGILLQRLHPLPNIRLHQLPHLSLIIQPVPRPRILQSQFPQRHQPRIYDAEFRIIHGCRAPAAGGVAAEHDVFDVEVFDGVLDYGEGVEVGGREDVGDVAVDEDVAGFET